MNLIKRIARRLVEEDILKEVGYRLRADAAWFIPQTNEHRVLHEVGESLINYGHWRIDRIREDHRLSSPHNNPERYVKVYPDGTIISNLDSSNATHDAIRKAYERTMPEMIWENYSYKKTKEQ